MMPAVGADLVGLMPLEAGARTAWASAIATRSNVRFPPGQPRGRVGRNRHAEQHRQPPCQHPKASLNCGTVAIATSLRLLCWSASPAAKS